MRTLKIFSLPFHHPSLLFIGQNYTVGINWAAERWDDAFISGEGCYQ